MDMVLDKDDQMKEEMTPRVKDESNTSGQEIAENDNNNNNNILCEMCKKKTSMYKCPRCSIKTCSLHCCKLHKSKFECNGKRNRTSYIPLYKFSDSDLKSDFHFLEDVLRVKDNVTRKNSQHRPSQRNNSQRNNHTARRNVGGKKEEQANVPLQPLLALSLKEDNKKEETNNNSLMEDEANQPPAKRIKISNTICDSTSKTSLSSSSCPITNKRNITSHSSQQATYHPPHLKLLLQEASYRNINLLFMPQGMQRRKENNSTFQKKQNRILWRVNWRFHTFSTTDTAAAATTTIVSTRISEKCCIFKELLKILDNYGKNNNTRMKHNDSNPPKIPCDFLSIPHLKSKHDIDTAKENVKTHNDNVKADIELLLLKIPSNDKQKKYFHIMNNHDSQHMNKKDTNGSNETEDEVPSSLQKILEGKTVIEYPTIEVVLSRDVNRFSTMIKVLK